MKTPEKTSENAFVFPALDRARRLALAATRWVMANVDYANRLTRSILACGHCYRRMRPGHLPETG